MDTRPHAQTAHLVRPHLYKLLYTGFQLSWSNLAETMCDKVGRNRSSYTRDGYDPRPQKPTTSLHCTAQMYCDTSRAER